MKGNNERESWRREKREREKKKEKRSIKTETGNHGSGGESSFRFQLPHSCVSLSLSLSLSLAMYESKIIGSHVAMATRAGRPLCHLRTLYGALGLFVAPSIDHPTLVSSSLFYFFVLLSHPSFSIFIQYCVFNRANHLPRHRRRLDSTRERERENDVPATKNSRTVAIGRRNEIRSATTTTTTTEERSNMFLLCAAALDLNSSAEVIY